MTSKEALKRLKQETAPATYMVDFDKDECIEIIRKDLERFNRLKERYKKRAEISNELCEALKKYEKIIDILNSHIGLCSYEVICLGESVKDVRCLLNISDESLSLEEYELLEEVFNR